MRILILLCMISFIACGKKGNDEGTTVPTPKPQDESIRKTFVEDMGKNRLTIYECSMELTPMKDNKVGIWWNRRWDAMGTRDTDAVTKCGYGYTTNHNQPGDIPSMNVVPKEFDDSNPAIALQPKFIDSIMDVEKFVLTKNKASDHFLDFKIQDNKLPFGKFNDCNTIYLDLDWDKAPYAKRFVFKKTTDSYDKTSWKPEDEEHMPTIEAITKYYEKPRYNAKVYIFCDWRSTAGQELSIVENWHDVTPFNQEGR